MCRPKMSRANTLLVGLIAIPILGTQGCSFDASDAPRAKQKTSLDRIKEVEREMDDLWRQGYGYNNPNVDRIRKGLPTVGMNGKEKE